MLLRAGFSLRGHLSPWSSHLPPIDTAPGWLWAPLPPTVTHRKVKTTVFGLSFPDKLTSFILRKGVCKMKNLRNGLPSSISSIWLPLSQWRSRMGAAVLFSQPTSSAATCCLIFLRGGLSDGEWFPYRLGRPDPCDEPMQRPQLFQIRSLPSSLIFLCWESTIIKPRLLPRKNSTQSQTPIIRRLVSEYTTVFHL